MKNANRRFVIICMLPAVLCLLLLFLYPILRIAAMSLFEMKTFTVSSSQWEFVGFSNFKEIFQDYTFRNAMWNLLKIWLYGGVGTFFFALLFAAILSSGVKGKSFWRALIFLPNTISAVALANMWTQYVYNSNFGLLTKVFSALGMEKLAAVQWTNPDNLFGSMLFAYCFACVGYYMLILLAGIEKIPAEYHESASIDGAGRVLSFFRITLPLIRGVLRNCLMFWTIGCVNFFTWSLMFAKTTGPSTVVPAVYMYNNIFGPDSSAGGMIDVGAGTSAAVVMIVVVVLAYALMNLIFPEKEMEY